MENYIGLTPEQFTVKFNNHLLWLQGSLQGERLYLNGYDLSYQNFDGLDLRGAAFINCYLRGSTFNNASCVGTDFSRSIITGCSFIETDLYGADFTHLDLCAVNMRRCDIRTADFSYSNFYQILEITNNMEDGVQVINSNYGEMLGCPEEGSFTGFKSAQGYIVKLLIPSAAARSTGTGRECRCSSAEVLSITFPNGTDSGLTSVHSDYDDTFIYTVGETVSVNNFDMNRWNTCTTGIHFFLTRKEALMR